MRKEKRREMSKKRGVKEEEWRKGKEKLFVTAEGLFPSHRHTPPNWVYDCLRSHSLITSCSHGILSWYCSMYLK